MSPGPKGDGKPTIYLSNWSSHKTLGHHGPGRKLTIMVNPRRWERGVCCVHTLTPARCWLYALQNGEMSVDEYRGLFEAMTEAWADKLRPGYLFSEDPKDNPPMVWVGGYVLVEDGDTLCCACSRDEAAAGRCHRVWAAHALARNGWRVILDGAEVQP